MTRFTHHDEGFGPQQKHGLILVRCYHTGCRGIRSLGVASMHPMFRVPGPNIMLAMLCTRD